MLWSMVNALQITTAFPLLAVKLPGPVYMILQTVSKLSSFELISADDVIGAIFPEGFSETDSVNSGWEAMDSDNKTGISNLGMVYLFINFFAASYLAYFILWLLKKRSKIANRIRRKMNKKLFWGTLLIFILEGYLDGTLASLANFESVHWDLYGDWVNNITILVVFSTILIFPFWSVCFLHRNR
jgi:hypothetical protein